MKGSSQKTLNVVVKKVRVPKEGRHGAVWKIAYADFVTALMAFFLLLWLLSASTTATLDGVGNVFDPNPQEVQETAAAGGLFGGAGKQKENIIQIQSNASYEDVNATQDSRLPYKSDATGVADEVSTGAKGSIEYDIVVDRASESADRLRQQIAGLPDGDTLEQTLFFHVAPQGVHMEMIIPENQPMFEIGSARLTQRVRVLLRPIVQLLASRSERISIGGYADSSGNSDSANWALSAERALAVRDFMVASGFPESRIEILEGYGDRRPQVDYDATAPGNRRLTITLLDADFMRLQDALTKETVPPLLLKDQKSN